MNKLRNSTHETFAAFACSFSLTAETKPSKKWSDWDFSRVLIVMSVKPALTDELLKLNSAFKPIFSVIEDQYSGGHWSSKWGRQHFKLQGYVKLVNKQPSNFWFHQVLRCFRVVLKPSLDFFKMFIGSRDHYELSRGKNKFSQNMNNLPKDYICTCLTCRSLAELFNFIGLVERQEDIYSNLQISVTIVDY